MIRKNNKSVQFRTSVQRKKTFFASTRFARDFLCASSIAAAFLDSSSIIALVIHMHDQFHDDGWPFIFVRSMDR